MDSQFIGQILALLPDNRQLPRTIPEIAEMLMKDAPGLGQSEAVMAVSTAIGMLELFGMLSEYEGRFRAKEQVPAYFVKSLTWYAEQGQTVLSNWHSKGVAEAIPASEMLDHAPHVLKLMELRRLRLAQSLNLKATPTRTVNVSFVLIKAVRGGDVLYLHQYDSRTRRYQLIGGRIEPGETPLAGRCARVHRGNWATLRSRHRSGARLCYSRSARHGRPAERSQHIANLWRAHRIHASHLLRHAATARFCAWPRRTLADRG